MDDLKAENKTPSSAERADLFLDKTAVKKVIAVMVTDMVKDVVYQPLIVDHIMNVCKK